MANTTDFCMTAGDTKTIAVNVIEKDDESPTDITGSTIAWSVARSMRTTAVITKTTSDGISITNGTGGTFTITLDAADTSALKGDYYHEAQITFSDSEVATVLKGKLTIELGLN